MVNDVVLKLELYDEAKQNVKERKRRRLGGVKRHIESSGKRKRQKLSDETSSESETDAEVNRESESETEFSENESENEISDLQNAKPQEVKLI